MKQEWHGEGAETNLLIVVEILVCYAPSVEELCLDIAVIGVANVHSSPPTTPRWQGICKVNRFACFRVTLVRHKAPSHSSKFVDLSQSDLNSWSMFHVTLRSFYTKLMRISRTSSSNASKSTARLV